MSEEQGEDPFAGFTPDEETDPFGDADASPPAGSEDEDPFEEPATETEETVPAEAPVEGTDEGTDDDDDPFAGAEEVKPAIDAPVEQPEETPVQETPEPDAEEDPFGEPEAETDDDDAEDPFAGAAEATVEEPAVATEESLFPEETAPTDPFGEPAERMSDKAYTQDTFQADLPATDDEFDLSDAAESKSRTFMVYGEKGDGKTVVGLSIILASGATDEHPHGTDTVYAMSFDRQTKKIVDDFYAYVDDDLKAAAMREDDSLTEGEAARLVAKRPEFLDRMKVKDGIRYLRKTSSTMWLESAVVSLRYVFALLQRDAPKFNPDWIMIDGLEMMVRDICELSMRCRNNLPAFSGVELNLWKERNMYVDDIFDQAARVAKKGVVVTAYVNEQAIKIEGGRVIETKRKPKWAANVRTHVGNVIRVEGKDDGDDGRGYTAYVESAKYMKLKTGIRVDVTGDAEKGIFKGFKDMFEQSKGVEAF